MSLEVLWLHVQDLIIEFKLIVFSRCGEKSHILYSSGSWKDVVRQSINCGQRCICQLKSTRKKKSKSIWLDIDMRQAAAGAIEIEDQCYC